jgi:hypothetical protein
VQLGRAVKRAGGWDKEKVLLLQAKRNRPGGVHLEAVVKLAEGLDKKEVTLVLPVRVRPEEKNLGAKVKLAEDQRKKEGPQLHPPLPREAGGYELTSQARLSNS